MPTQRKSRPKATAAATAGLTDEQIKQQKEELAAGRSPSRQERAAHTDDPILGHQSEHTVVPEGGIRADQLTRRSADDAFTGHFAVLNRDVDYAFRGEERTLPAGTYGVYESTISTDEKTGQPDLCRFRTRDARNVLVVVPYDALTPTQTRGSAPR